MDNSYKVDLLDSNKNWMFYKIKCKISNLKSPLFKIYGSIHTDEKTNLWDTIVGRITYLDPKNFILRGDFNANFGPHWKEQRYKEN